MTTAKLNEQANDMLVGLTIESTGDNWIKLDNGIVIYCLAYLKTAKSNH